MEFFKIPLVIILPILVSTLINSIQAQNSPQDFVDAHNQIRAKHNLLPVEWDEPIATYAQNYANKRSADCKMEHSQGPYGENLAFSSGKLTAAEAVKYWADEEKFYNYDSNTCAEGQVCGHYTQLVWSDSSLIGCATIQCRNNNFTFVTCNYDPAGNFVGERPY